MTTNDHSCLLFAVISASSNEVPTYLPTLYAAYIEKAGSVSKFFSGPSAGGGGGGGAAGALF